MNEGEQEKTRRKLRKIGDEFLKLVRERVDNCVLLCDVEGLSELTHAVDVVLSYKLVKTIQEKGFGKEFKELCDKVGRKK